MSKWSRGTTRDADDPEFIDSVFYDYGLDSVRDSRTGCEPILPNWEQWADFADGEDEGEPESGGFPDYEVFPGDAIQLRYACRAWIPAVLPAIATTWGLISPPARGVWSAR